MAKHILNLFLELGTSSFRASVVEFSNQLETKMRLFSVPAVGIKSGVVKDHVAAVGALSSLLDLIEAQGFVGISKCHLVIPAVVTTSKSIECSLLLNGVTTANEHREHLRSEALSASCDDNQEVVELVEQVWRIDQDPHIKFPAGKSGQRLVLNSFCAVIEKSLLLELVAVCNDAGLAVNKLLSGILGAKRLINHLSPDAANKVILDIGHLSTSGILCVGHKENSTFAIRAGSKHITSDIAAALHLELNDAEALKIQCGLSFTPQTANVLGPAASASLSDSDLTTNSKFTKHGSIYPWAAPRVFEILSLCLKHFAIYAKALDGGVVLIGSGSQLKEICSYLAVRLSGVKFTRFKPTLDVLSNALGLVIVSPKELSLSGFEGLINHSWESIQNHQQKYGKIKGQTPQFLRPLLTWFIDLSK